jgi:coproporphyrinogen III oxidase-like Fe-S oxidoreductase
VLLQGWLRNRLKRLLLDGRPLALVRRVPSLEDRFRGLDAVGLYLHVPFCRQICPYCPYNKELYNAEVARRYADAVKVEIDRYAEWIGDLPVTSFYIGGGTPTTMLDSGLAGILEHVYKRFSMQCGVHMESHPNDLSADNLATIAAMGIEYLSIGVEALQDHHLRALHRPYTVEQVMAAVERAVGQGFCCVNVDTIFALPGQRDEEVRQTGHLLVEMGVDQIAAYPLFRFPYTRWSRDDGRRNHHGSGLLARKRMLGILERIFCDAGFERTSVWAFTRPGVGKYCSVTVPLYLGLGASGGSYLRDVFYLNTFHVGEYIRAIEAGRMPIALSIELSAEMQMAGWLYWRIYETRFRRSDFERRFGLDLDRVYGRYIRLLSLIGWLEDDGDELVLSDDGIYWLHVLQDLFSIQYVSTLWGTAQQDPWPEKVLL